MSSKFRIKVKEIDENFELPQEEEIEEFNSSEQQNTESSSIVIEEDTFKPLERDELQKLNTLLPEIEKNDVIKEFFIREATLNPPNGEIENEVFPPSQLELPPLPSRSEDGEISIEEQKEELVEEVKLRPITVSGHSPYNHSTPYSLTFSLSITFSEIIIELATVKKEVNPLNIIITPPVEGEWNWTNTNTIEFTPTTKWNGRTEYNVKVPKGISSIVSECLPLEEDYEFVFTTSLQVTNFDYTRNTLQPIILFVFDQKIQKPDNVIHHFFLSRKKLIFLEKRFEIENISLDDPSAKELLKNIPNYEEDRCFAYRPVDQLPNSTNIYCGFNGIQSAEGPIQVDFRYSNNFYTHKSFKLNSNSMKRNTGEYSSFNISFSSTINEKHLNDIGKFIKIDTEDIHPVYSVVENNINISHDKIEEPRTINVTISRELTDQLNQHLEGSNYFTLKVVKPKPYKAHSYQHLCALNYCQYGLIKKEEDQTAKYCFMAENFSELRIILFKVTIADFERFNSELNRYNVHHYTALMNLLEKKIVYDKIIKYQVDSSTQSFDITPYLDENKTGHLVIYIEPTKKSLWKNALDHLMSGSWWKNRVHIFQWIDATNMLLHTIQINGYTCFFVVNVNDFKPFPGVSLYNNENLFIGKTDELGLYIQQGPCPSFVLAEYENDRTFYAPSAPSFYEYPPIIFHIIDDRKLYKPKEEIHIKGFIRNLSYPNTGTPHISIFDQSKIKYRVVDPRGNILVKDEDLNIDTTFGTFELIFLIPDGTNLGTIQFIFIADQVNTSHYVTVEEFRTPEFDCSINEETSGPYLPFTRTNQYSHVQRDLLNHLLQNEVQSIKDDQPLRDLILAPKEEGRSLSNSLLISSEILQKSLENMAIFNVSAKYYAGGTISNSQIDWKFSTSTITEFNNFTRWSGFTFTGIYNPNFPLWPGFTSINNFIFPNFSHSGKTNAKGNSRLLLEFKGHVPPSGINVSLETKVLDISSKSIIRNSSFSIYPSNIAVGIKHNCPTDIELVVIDIKTQKLVGDVPIFLSISNYYRTLQFIVLSSAKKSIIFPYTEYFTNASAFVIDDKGRCHSSVTNYNYKYEPETYVTLKLDKTEYIPGDIMKVKLQPRMSGYGVISFIVGKYIRSESFTVQKSVPLYYEYLIEEDYVPTCVVDVQFYQFNSNKHHESIQKQATVSKDHKLIEVEVTPKSQKLIPNESSEVKVKVTKDSNTLANVDVLMFIVDDAILNTAGYSLTNPLESFFPMIPTVVRDSSQLHTLLFPQNYPTEEPDPKEANEEQENIDEDDGDYGCGIEQMDYCKKNSILPSMDSFSLGAPGGGGGRGGRQVAKESLKMKEDRKMKRSVSPSASSSRSVRPGSAALPKSGGAPPVKLTERKDFNPLITFESKKTNDDGEVLFSFDMKSSITRYKVYAIAAYNSDNFGIGSSSVSVTLPLTIRQSPPRFLSFGDRNVSIVAIVTNQTEQSLPVHLLMKTYNFQLRSSSSSLSREEIENLEVDPIESFNNIDGYKFVLPPNGRKKITFIGDTYKAGEAKFQIVAKTEGDFTDFVSFNIPVYTPYTSESFASYGTTDKVSDIVKQPFVIPFDAHKEFGSLSITLTSSLFQELSAPIIYLFDYQYNCNEQISSKLIPILLLEDFVLQFVKPSQLETESLENFTQGCLDTLLKRQLSNGGFGYWSSDEKYASPYVSCQIGLLIATVASKNKYKVDQQCIDNLIAYLRKITKFTFIIPFLSYFTNWLVFSYSLYVRMLLGDSIDDIYVKAEKMFKKFKFEASSLSLEIVSWLLLIFKYYEERGQLANENENHPVKRYIKKILKYIQDNLVEEGPYAHLVISTSEMEGFHALHSSTRTDAIVLYSLLYSDPKSHIIPKLAKSILRTRRNGVWRNTQENCYCLFALSKYFEEYEGEEPDFQSRLWLDQRYTGDVEYKGRSLVAKQIQIPMKYLHDDFAEDIKKIKKSKNESNTKDIETSNRRSMITIQKEGAGRLYYNFSLSYAPQSLHFDPLERGFTLARSYKSINDPNDIRIENGEIYVKLNSVIQITLTYVTKTRKYHVAIVDQLPAGFEPINPALSGNFSSAYGSYISTDNLNHVNYRTERVEGFTFMLYPGRRDFKYLVNVTNCGTFQVSPAKIEEMYSPELFARTSTLTMHVVENF